jgi:hypothetical protein
MVRHYIQHDPHVTFMHIGNQVLKLLFSSELRTDLIEILGPVSMIPVVITVAILIHVLHNRGDPYCVES